MRWRIGSEWRDENGMYGWFMVPVPEPDPRMAELLRLADADQHDQPRIRRKEATMTDSRPDV